MTTNTGGPAFPCHPGIENSIYDGMTLRDYFAGKAMQGYLGDSEWLSNVSPKGTSEAAYRMADAMLEARQS